MLLEPPLLPPPPELPLPELLPGLVLPLEALEPLPVVLLVVLPLLPDDFLFVETWPVDGLLGLGDWVSLFVSSSDCGAPCVVSADPVCDVSLFAVVLPVGLGLAESKATKAATPIADTTKIPALTRVIILWVMSICLSKFTFIRCRGKID